jgi:mono/diheme cytochrome c family protein
MFPRLILFCGALLGMVASIHAETDDSPAAIGHQILLKNCARCHAIETVGDSPLAEAPPFREVAKRYDPVNLEEALAEGIVTGHDEMPEFIFEPDEIVAITAYLSTLRPE